MTPFEIMLKHYDASSEPKWTPTDSSTEILAHAILDHLPNLPGDVITGLEILWKETLLDRISARSYLRKIDRRPYTEPQPRKPRATEA